MKTQAMIFYSLDRNLIPRNLRFSTSAPLVPSMALALRSSAPLLALALALAYQPLAQLPTTFPLALDDLLRSTRCSCHLDVLKAHHLRLLKYD
jgi:hypothetical protein